MSEFIPVALKLDEAHAAFRACQVAFDQLGLPPAADVPNATEARGAYARAMVTIGTAIDKAQA